MNRALLCLSCLLASPAALAQSGLIALVQYDGDSRFDQYALNRERLTALADEAVRHGARIIVFPEGSSYGYGDEHHAWCGPQVTETQQAGCVDIAQAAERVPEGPSTAYWAAYARGHGVYILFDEPEADAGAYFNTAVAVGPQGYLGRYRKHALYRQDTLYAVAGTEPLVLDTPFGRLGVLICLDVTSPGYLEQYKQMGVDAALLLMDWDDDPHGPYAAETFIAARAAAAGLDVYASDNPAWDGTGKYPASGGARERVGLAAHAVGREGISYHRIGRQRRLRLR